MTKAPCCAICPMVKNNGQRHPAKQIQVSNSVHSGNSQGIAEVSGILRPISNPVPWSLRVYEHPLVPTQHSSFNLAINHCHCLLPMAITIHRVGHRVRQAFQAGDPPKRHTRPWDRSGGYDVKTEGKMSNKERIVSTQNNKQKMLKTRLSIYAA